MSCTKRIIQIFTVLVLHSYSWSALAQGEMLDREVTIAFEDLSIRESLQKLEQATGINTAYNGRDLKNTRVTITFERELISEVLDALLTNKDLSYKVIGNTITIFRKQEQTAQKAIERFTLSGYVVDESSGETLIGASIYCNDLDVGTTTNEYGFYSITVPQGDYEFVYSYVGYTTSTESISLQQNKTFSAHLNLGAQLNEVIVRSDDPGRRHASTRISSNKISLDDVKSMPVLMGERDVLKVIQLLPGVQSGSEGTTGLYVRGGGPDQNLMLLDGVPVYNASHLFGFMSTFNGDAIKSVELIKGGFPARFGGRLSSIIDVRMKEGNLKKIHGDITVGLISGRFNLEGPIVKDKTSFSISARRTWLDLFTTPLQKLAHKKRKPGDLKSLNIYYLYDVNLKVNHKFSDKSRLYLSSYFGNDLLKHESEDLSYKEKGALEWGNRILTMRWNYQFSPKLFSNTTIYHSGYNFGFKNAAIEGHLTKLPVSDIYSSNSKIQDQGIKIDFNFIPHPNHHIRFGVKYGIYKFTPTSSFQEVKEGDLPAVKLTKGDPDIRGSELSAYIEDDVVLTEHIQLNVGVHLANFDVQNAQYFSAQPRAALSYLLSDRSSLKISATRMTQFLHMLSSPGLGLPTDLWVASTAKIKPENSWQFDIGYTRSLDKGYEMTVEAFYKEMDNLLEYKSGFNFFSTSQDWENSVNVGTGTSYGTELLLKKNTGKITGWIGYTLSKSDRSFPAINSGIAFPYKYDRRHDVGLTATYTRSERLDFGLVWVYGTGNTYTLSTTNYNALGIGSQVISEGDPFETIATTNHIESRNNQRMPAYHRLDLSVSLHKVKKRGMRTWSFGVYNAYARQNPFVVYSTFDQTGVPTLKQQSLIPILPYFTYSFKF